MAPRSRDILTPAQWRVLAYMGAGRRPEGIARELGLSVSTVKAHIGAIYQLQPIGRATDKRAAAVAWYRAELLRRVGAASETGE